MLRTDWVFKREYEGTIQDKNQYVPLLTHYFLTFNLTNQGSKQSRENDGIQTAQNTGNTTDLHVNKHYTVVTIKMLWKHGCPKDAGKGHFPSGFSAYFTTFSDHISFNNNLL